MLNKKFRRPFSFLRQAAVSYKIRERKKKFFGPFLASNSGKSLSSVCGQIIIIIEAPFPFLLSEILVEKIGDPRDSLPLSGRREKWWERERERDSAERMIETEKGEK